MADNIGVKLEAEGAGEFRKSLKEINDTFKVLGSEMKLVASQFDKNDNSIEAMTAKNKVLNKEIDEQKGKVGLLENALKASAAQYGENDSRTQKWAVELNNAQAKLNNLEREVKQNEAAMNGMGNETKDLGNDLDKAGDKANGFGDKISSAMRVAGVAILAAGAAVGALVKASIEGYAEYEQLTGGVETLFKESSNEVMKYANSAYKTAGLSANEYMSTVTSFSASLLQSLDGDTAAAAKAADTAITDMADNANKMGTSMESVQTAYQGFAKQNYTMLDNLKLGYGGTKTEMERLLSDAEALSGVKYDIGNLGDVYEAIHVVQTEIGITGTTAKEASTTIEGSVSAMKSAWGNLVAGIADDNADFEGLITNLVESVATAGNNILPRIEQILVGIGEAIAQLAPIISEKIPEIITQILPSLLEAAGSVITALVSGLIAALPAIIPAAVTMVMQLIDTLIENLPLLIEAAVQIVVSLAQGIAESLPELIPAVVEAIITIVDTLIENIDLLIDASIAIMIALADGLIEALPKLIEKVPEIVIKLLGALIENAPKILAAGVALIGKLIEGVWSVITTVVKMGGDIIGKVGEGISGAFNDVVDWGKDIINKLLEGMKAAWEGVKTWFSGVWNSLFGNNTANVTVNKKVTGGVDGSNANGLDYVPFDGYISELHRGEMVVPANLADGLRNIGITAKKQTDLAGLMSSSVNAINMQGGGNQRVTVEIPISINGKELYRATLQDLWSVMSATPRVVGDAI